MNTCRAAGLTEQSDEGESDVKLGDFVLEGIVKHQN